MRSFIIALGIAVATGGGTTFFTHRIEVVSKKVLEDNKQVVEAVLKDDFERAKKLAHHMAEYVDSKKMTMSLIMDHGDLDKIEQGIAELEGYIEGEVKNDSIAKCKFLDVLIRHLPRNYKLKIENIL